MIRHEEGGVMVFLNQDDMAAALALDFATEGRKHLHDLAAAERGQGWH
jgi:hypothetical protein